MNAPKDVVGWGEYLRMRVKLIVLEPLPRGKNMTLGGMESNMGKLLIMKNFPIILQLWSSGSS